MNIISKTTTKIQSKGNNQFGIVFKRETMEDAKLSYGDTLSITVLENGSILLEKVDKKHESR